MSSGIYEYGCWYSDIFFSLLFLVDSLAGRCWSFSRMLCQKGWAARARNLGLYQLYFFFPGSKGWWFLVSSSTNWHWYGVVKKTYLLLLVPNKRYRFFPFIVFPMFLQYVLLCTGKHKEAKANQKENKGKEKGKEKRKNRKKRKRKGTKGKEKEKKRKRKGKERKRKGIERKKEKTRKSQGKEKGKERKKDRKRKGKEKEKENKRHIYYINWFYLKLLYIVFVIVLLSFGTPWQRPPCSTKGGAIAEVVP